LNNVITSQDLAKDLTTFLKDNSFSSIAVLVDENTEMYCYPKIKNFLPSHKLIIIKSGEEEKNLSTCTKIWEEMTSFNMDRHGLMINLGGGVIGDMGGFCAATYKRGIRFIQVPTTLLSQVDASIGGKLGIDFHHYKNHIGVFKDPEAVFIFTSFFDTLPKAELRSGFAEILKHCLIADKTMWNKIKDHDLENQNLLELVTHSIDVKSKIVEEDPFEKNIRKALNFGHTIGHAVESFFLDLPGKKLLHGEAIAIGMICESWVGNQQNLLTKADLKEIENFILTIYPKINISESTFDTIVEHTLQDKKNKSNKVLAALLDGIGKIKLNVELTADSIKDSLRYYNQLNQN
jgi:3-dehydroquinate synthase